MFIFKNNIFLFLRGVVQKPKILILLDQVIVSGTSFATILLIARFMGLDLMGKYSWFLMCNQLLLVSQCALIINPMMTRLFNVSFYAKLNYFHSSLVVLLVFVFCSYKHFYVNNSEYLCNTILLVVTSYSILSYEFLRRIMFFKDQYMQVLLLDSLRGGGTLIGVIGCSKFNSPYLLGLDSLVFNVFFASMVSRVLLYKMTKYKLFDLSSYIKKISFSDIGVSLRHSIFLLISGLLNWYLSNSIFFHIGSAFGYEKLGYIRSIQNITGLFNLAYQSFENYLPAKLSEIYIMKGEKDMFKKTIKISFYGFGFIGAICLGLGIISTKALFFIYNKDFSSYQSLVYILLFYSSLSFLTFPFSYYIRVVNSNFFFIFADFLASIPLVLFFVISNNLTMLFWGMILSKLIQVISLFSFIYLKHIQGVSSMPFGGKVKTQYLITKRC